MDGHADNWAIPPPGASVPDANIGYVGSNDAYNAHNGHADDNNNNHADDNNNNHVNNGMVHEHRQSASNDV